MEDPSVLAEHIEMVKQQNNMIRVVGRRGLGENVDILLTT